MKKLIKKYEIKGGTRGKHGQVNSSGKSGAPFVKNEISRINDFGQFTKISQLLQCITCSIFKLCSCSWTFWKGL